MEPSEFRLLVVADLHHVPGASGPGNLPERRVDLAAELLRRAIEDATHRGGVDAIALMGDLLDDGTRADATEGLEQLREVVRQAAGAAASRNLRAAPGGDLKVAANAPPSQNLGVAPGGGLGTTPVPLLVVPGNHDGDFDRLYAVFGARPGAHRIGPCRFVVFADRYAPGDVCTRSQADEDMLLQTAQERGAGVPPACGEGILPSHGPDSAGETPAGHAGKMPAPQQSRPRLPDATVRPIIVLQHNPMNPDIDSSQYPYMLTNRPQVMADYARAGVALSISGHAHWGQELNFDRGVGYFTCPALCEAPYRYAIVTLRGRQVDAKVHSLQMPASPPVVDVHVHTEFAYCGREIAAERMIARAREMGLAGVVLAEHVPQLYEPAEDFWTGKHVRSPGLWRSGQGWRIDAYRAAMDRLRRDPYVKIGLEVELDADGHLVLRDEDRDWADVLVGALHFVSRESKTLTDAELTAEFLRFTEPLVHSGVDVLAHPLRVFSWIQRPTPPELLAPLAQLLADNGVAAEINFHLNYPEDEFFAQCIARGVKIAFGSDSHELAEVGNLGANLAMVQRLAGRQDVTDLLYYP